MKMMDDGIDFDIRRKKRKPSPEPVVVKSEKIIQSPVEEKRTGAGVGVGSFGMGTNRGVGGGGPSGSVGGRRAGFSGVVIQDPRGTGRIVGASVGREVVVPPRSGSDATRGRERVLPSSRIL